MSYTQAIADQEITRLEHWLKTAPKGDVLVYHTGLLMADRQEDTALDHYARRLLWESEWSQRVVLVQKRLGDACQYRAVKS